MSTLYSAPSYAVKWPNVYLNSQEQANQVQRSNDNLFNIHILRYNGDQKTVFSTFRDRALFQRNHFPKISHTDFSISNLYLYYIFILYIYEFINCWKYRWYYWWFRYNVNFLTKNSISWVYLYWMQIYKLRSFNLLLIHSKFNYAKIVKIVRMI